MLDASASAHPGTSRSTSNTVPDARSIIPAWALEAAASAPRISPADAGPLVAIFAEARAACDAAAGRFREQGTAYVRPTGCPCGCDGGTECKRHRPVLAEADWPDYGNQGQLHAGQCGPHVCGRVA